MKKVKLNSNAVERIKLACEIVEIEGEFSCLAVEFGFGDEAPDANKPKRMKRLPTQYARFYDKEESAQWGFEDRKTEAGKCERIIAMLLFAEANR